MLSMTRRVLGALALAVFLAAPTLAAEQSPVDCSHADADFAAAWPHPARPYVVALLCRHDPFPGWWDTLWIADTRTGASTGLVEVPLHGTGVDRFEWLDCPGALVARVVDRTHMGTVTDRVLRFDFDDAVEVLDPDRMVPGADRERPLSRCPR